LARCRAVIAELSTTHRLPPENILTPDSVRRLAWSPPRPPTPTAVTVVLRALGARPWQTDLTADRLAAALAPPR
jgi:ribonuclease D